MIRQSTQNSKCSYSKDPHKLHDAIFIRLNDPCWAASTTSETNIVGVLALVETKLLYIEPGFYRDG